MGLSKVHALASAFGTTATALLDEQEDGQLEALVERAREITLFSAKAGLASLNKKGGPRP